MAAKWSAENLKAAADWSEPQAAKARRIAEHDARDRWQPWYSPKAPEPDVPREHLLYEGNFPEWYQMITRVLKKNKLWVHVRHNYMRRPNISPERMEKLEQDDIQAINIIIMHVQPIFLAHQPIERPISTAYDFVQQLEKGAKPFRLMDLPRELRDRIYEMELVVPEEDRWGPPGHFRQRRPLIALEISSGFDPYLLEHPALLRVSRQVREEADEIYWAKNEFSISVPARYEIDGFFDDDDELRIPMQQMQHWVGKIGMHRLKHLRDFTVGVELCYKPSHCEPDYFRVKLLGDDKGLQVEWPARFAHGIVKDVKQDVKDWHFVATETRRRRMGWKGEGIIDYFLSEREFWSEWFFSYPEREVYDDEDDDEE